MDERNAYSSILNTMSRQAGSRVAADGMKLYLGTVLSAEPLSVSVAGTVQSAEHFYINEALCVGHKEEVQLEGIYEGTGLDCACTGGYNSPSISGDMLADVEETVMEPVLHTGDLVVCLSADDQKFYLVCRVVSAA